MKQPANCTNQGIPSQGSHQGQDAPNPSTPEATKHTPGPWTIDPHSYERLIRGNDGTALAVVGVINMHERRNEGSANARLIAAAPDMLSALKKYEEAATKLTDQQLIDNPLLMEAIAESRELISKAGAQ